MSTLITQVAALAALLVLVTQLLGNAPLERTLVLAAGAGLAVYGALVVGTIVTQRVLASAAAAPPPEPKPTTPTPPEPPDAEARPSP